MNKTLALILLFLCLGVLACLLPGTPTPVIQCTAPACPAGDLYCPGGDCPGGCGTRCATWTPDPALPSPTPTLSPEAFCQIVVRTPPPEAPTASVNGTPNPNRRVDPHVEICASATDVAVGDPLVLVGLAVDIGQPAWTLHAREAAAGEFAPVLTVGYTGQVQPGEGSLNLFTFVDSQVSITQVVIHLQALAPGEIEFRLHANGEIHYGSPGPATWGGGNSDDIRVLVR